MQWRANEMHIWFSVWMLISVLPTVVFAIAGLRTAAWIYFLPTFAVALSFMVRRYFFRHRYFRSAGQALGISANFLRPIEVRPGKHEAWCQKHGVVPLSQRDTGAE